MTEIERIIDYIVCKDHISEGSVIQAKEAIEQYVIKAMIKTISSFLSYSPTENNLSCFFERASEGRKLDKLFELYIAELKKELQGDKDVRVS